MIKGYNESILDQTLISNLIKAIPLYGDKNTKYSFQVKRYRVPEKNSKLMQEKKLMKFLGKTMAPLRI